MLAKNLQAAAGNAAEEAPDITELFSTYLYTGNGSTQTITNGIDLAGEGGLVWIKARTAAGGSDRDHVLFDTNRGVLKNLRSNFNTSEITTSASLTSFNSDGFSLGSSVLVNYTGSIPYASWTFRKQPKFFDVVTWTGNGSFQNVSHNLGSVPGFIVYKRIDSTSDWFVGARNSAGNYELLKLNTTAASGGAASAATLGITATKFDPFSLGASNVNGATYVAYLFAHNAGGFGESGTDNVISCGSYIGSGTTSNTVTLGYEPQWLLIRGADTNAAWMLFDVMRGMPVSPGGVAPNDSALRANVADAETSAVSFVNPTATGFELTISSNETNAAGNTYIYIAIRRGPMKTPTTGTSVYSVQTYNGNATARTLTTGFPVDVAIAGSRASASVSSFPGSFTSRLTGANKYIVSSSTAAEVSNPGVGDYAVQNGIGLAGGNNVFNWTSTPYVLWAMRRAPGFMDAVCHTGTGTNLTLAHNLTVAPELVITKKRSAINEWYVSHTFTGTGYKRQYLEQTAAATDHLYSANFIYTAQPTASSLFFTGNTNVNQSTAAFVHYLFASLPGVSKVGSYTGTGATQVINCGFTGSARFVLIKATSTTGNWMVWDTARGIITSVDPYLMFNSKVDEITSTDWVDPASSGFELSNAAGNLANSNGVSYIFLAIA